MVTAASKRRSFVIFRNFLDKSMIFTGLTTSENQ